MITFLLPSCGIADLIFRLRITLFLIGDREFNIALHTSIGNRNLISYKFFAHDMGFYLLGLHQVDIQNIDSNDIITPFDIFKDQSILNCKKDIFVDIDCPFWKHKDMMEYAESLPTTHPALEAAFKSGNIYKDRLPDAKYSSTVFVHYRLGDVALVTGAVVNEALSISDFSGYAFVGDYLIRLDKLRRFLEMRPFIKDRIIVPNVYAALIDRLINEGLTPVVCSDGYTRTATAVSRAFDKKLSMTDIEKKLTSYILKDRHRIIKSGVTAIIGENTKNAENVFRACLNSKYWVRGTSDFPFTFFLNSGIAERFKYQLSKSSLDDIVNYALASNSSLGIVK